MANNTIALNNLTYSDIYPVGSIYLTLSEVNPQNLFGGVWQKLEDVFLFGASSNKPLNSRGGKKKLPLQLSKCLATRINKAVNGLQVMMVGLKLKLAITFIN